MWCCGGITGEQSEIRSEAKADFRIEFENGSSATFCLADPGSSVVVRDKERKTEV
jgi:hypothetical protein